MAVWSRRRRQKALEADILDVLSKIADFDDLGSNSPDRRQSDEREGPRAA